MKQKMYVVPVTEAVEGQRRFLVQASSAKAARQHVTQKFVGEAAPADGVIVASLMADGVKPEIAAEPA